MKLLQTAQAAAASPQLHGGRGDTGSGSAAGGWGRLLCVGNTESPWRGHTPFLPVPAWVFHLHETESAS